MHELAYYRRIRFGNASEALACDQRLLFKETVDMGLAASKGELESQSPAKRDRRQPLQSELPRIEHRHEPGSRQCGHMPNVRSLHATQPPTPQNAGFPRFLAKVSRRSELAYHFARCGEPAAAIRRKEDVPMLSAQKKSRRWREKTEIILAGFKL